jgi:uncharacterized protein (DUF924 family)
MADLESAALAFQSEWFKGEAVQPYWFAARSQKYRPLMERLCAAYLPICLRPRLPSEFSSSRVAVLVCILLDQMPRNAKAISLLDDTDETDLLARKILLSIMPYFPYDQLTIPELCFASLVFRHARTDEYFDLADKVLLDSVHNSHPLVQRFLAETSASREKTRSDAYIAKALTDDRPTLMLGPDSAPSDSSVLDEFRDFQKPELSELLELPLVGEMKNKLTGRFKRVLLSLSGGVDSMAHLLILSALPDIELLTLHLAYPLNRQAGQSELETMWISHACKVLGVPFYTYNVQLKRPHEDKSGGISRDEFERVTKEIRFRMYRLLEPDVVILGHHADDRDENAIEQLTRGHSIGDLCGMAGEMPDMHGVHLMRPLIHRRKRDFKELCKQYSMYHLVWRCHRICWFRMGHS